jgi:hypothetical protein
MKTKWVRWGLVAAAAVIGLGSMQYAKAQDQKRRIDVSPAAQIVQRIGLHDVKVTYCRPGVKGREIWNTNIVPYNGKPMPWRAGANENTVIEFEADVKIEGQPLPAGKYGFHIIPTEGKWTLIFSKDNASWGSFRYKQENDALRVEVTPVEAPMEEWLRYGFDDLTATSATGYVAWEKKKIPFKIELAAAK